MKVKDLIKELQKLDPDLDVGKTGPASMDGPAFFRPFTFVSVNTDTRSNLSKKDIFKEYLQTYVEIK